MPIVYFTEKLEPASLLKLFEAVDVSLPGKTAVKVHSGEEGNQNYIKPDFMKPMVDAVSGTIVECNTAYEGERNTTEKHEKLMESHGWKGIAPVEILDADGEIALKADKAHHLDVNYVGKGIEDYDSLLVLSHFKGHPMGGFGGALKNISIGLASSHGKAYIHGVKDVDNFWNSDHDSFLECMADAAKTIDDKFKGKVVYINIMKNMSVDCDCCAVAEDPCIADIGILASTDPVALDQACVDLVYASKDPGRDHLVERIESRNGIHTVDAAAELGVGSKEYELVSID